MAKIKVRVGYPQRVEEADSLDKLIANIRQIETNLKTDGATSFDMEYDTLQYDSYQYLFIRGWREETDEEQAERERKRRFQNELHRDNLRRQLAEVEGELESGAA